MHLQNEATHRLLDHSEFEVRFGSFANRPQKSLGASGQRFVADILCNVGTALPSFIAPARCKNSSGSDTT